MSDAVATVAATTPADGAPERPDRRGRRAPAVVPRAPLSRRLGFRLAALLAVALLPLGLLSFLQADGWLATAREQRAALLLGETLRAAAPEAGLIREAQGAAAALARTIRPLLGEEAACDAAMSYLVAGSPQYSLAAYIPPDGRMTCASNGAAYDFAGNPIFRAIVSGSGPRLLVNPRGPVSGTSVLVVVHPVLARQGGGYSGHVTLSLPHGALRREAVPAEDPDGTPDFVTFDRDGTVLTSSLDFARAPEILPRGIELGDSLGAPGAVFTATSAAGEARTYAVVPLIEGELYALGSVPAQEAMQLVPVSFLSPFLLAALMWAGSVVVAWIAAEHQVSRYIRRLGRAIRGFASGSRVVGDLDMQGAPAEIREVGQAFLRMTDTILHDEAELEDTVHQREVLLREVHHRVKNNLQLIASIMNMQSRRARSPETKALMKGLQERVMSLATVHKELYQTSGLTDVRADELLGDITRQIVGMASAPGRTFRIRTDFAPIPLTPDQAVPLSLLLTEGLTNAIKYAEAEPGEASPALDLRFAEFGEGRAELTIANTAGAIPSEPPAVEGTGLGRQLVAAFASQLGGEVRSEARDGCFTLRVEFALASVRGGEPAPPPG